MAVANGLEAWKVLIDVSKQIDLVLTEVVMPYLSGIGLLAKIMKNVTRKNTLVIMMSSDDSMGIVFNCLSKGAFDFLVFCLSNVPCYFYLRGFCSKGDTCSFLHGPAAISVTNEVPCEKKLSVATNAGSKPVKSHPDPPESVQIKHTQPVEKRTQDSHQLASGVTEKSEPVQIKENVKHVVFAQSDQNVEDEGLVQSEKNLKDEKSIESEENVKHEEFVQSESDVFDDQSLDGYVQSEKNLQVLTFLLRVDQKD